MMYFTGLFEALNLLALVQFLNRPVLFQFCYRTEIVEAVTGSVVNVEWPDHMKGYWEAWPANVTLKFHDHTITLAIRSATRKNVPNIPGRTMMVLDIGDGKTLNICELDPWTKEELAEMDRWVDENI